MCPMQAGGRTRAGDAMEKIRVGIIGATGYAGAELVRILLGHPGVRIVWYGSHSYVDQKISSVYGNLFRLAEGVCREERLEELAGEADVIFTATPQGFLSGLLREELLRSAKVIDLSADYRLRDARTYEEWYGMEHKSPRFLGEAVYGLCERNRERIAHARLVANPGCYPTCSILAIWPLLEEGLIDPDTLIIDAKSGVSGAGRGAKVDNLYCEVNENMKAYGVAKHRHTPEIEEQLSQIAGREVRVSFTPHLVPMNRGILITAYASLRKEAFADIASACFAREAAARVRGAYMGRYAGERFVRVLDPEVCPQTRWVEGSNYVDVNACVDGRTGRVIMMGAMDNLVKGAAGQAVQNMNLMFGLPEETGLLAAPIFP